MNRRALIMGLLSNVNGAAGTEAARKEITEILRNVPVPEMNK